MSTLVSGFEYDMFISYRHNDNRSGWVTEFINALQEELAATIKEPLSIYFDKNPHDGLLETHNVDKSLQGKLKCLIFIPIISQTYCDPKSFAWQHEFCAFNKLAKEDQFGRDVKLTNGNVASRILPIKIHDLDAEDKTIIENEIGGALRAIEFIFNSTGVSRPLTSSDKREENANKTFYRDQINKVARATKELIVGIQHGKDLTKAESVQKSAVPNRSRKKITLVVVIALVLGLGSYGLYYLGGQGNKIAPTLDRSIAVMPFVNMSSDKEQEYFSDGLTEDIITQLSKIKSLKVISRTSVMQYKEKPKPLKEVGKELGVAAILEGSVQRAGDQVRITAQLIMAETDEHIWAESYDRPMKDIFAVQREVATAIAAVLKATLSGKEIQQLDKLPTSSLTAYDQYLKGKYLTERRTKEDMANAIEFFKKAITEDSVFVDAISALADAYLLSSSRGYDDPKRMFPVAEKLTNKALRLQPASGPAHASRGFLLEQNYDYHGAEIEFRKSIELEPNQSNVYNWLAHIKEAMGDCEEAIKIYDAGIAFNPEWDVIKGNRTRCLIRTGRGEEALKEDIRWIAAAADRDVPAGYSYLAMDYWQLGRKSEAISAAEKAVDLMLLSLYRDGDSTIFKADKLKSAEQLLQQQKNGEYISMFELGGLYYWAGKKAKAFECYNKAMELRDPNFTTLLISVDPGREEMRKKLRALIKF